MYYFNHTLEKDKLHCSVNTTKTVTCCSLFFPVKRTKSVSLSVLLQNNNWCHGYKSVQHQLFLYVKNSNYLLGDMISNNLSTKPIPYIVTNNNAEQKHCESHKEHMVAKFWIKLPVILHITVQRIAEDCHHK